jgi:IS605 OrfB family transposase
MEHKISRSVVDYAVEQQAGMLTIGDARDIANGRGKGRKQNQKLSTWRHGKLRAKMTYKAKAEGIRVVLVDEHHTSKTCPNPTCNQRHKPTGACTAARSVGFRRTAMWSARRTSSAASCLARWGRCAHLQRRCIVTRF